MPSGPFEKLLELGFSGAAQVAAEAAGKPKAESAGSSQTAPPKRKRKKKKSSVASGSSVAAATVAMTKAEKMARKRKKAAKLGAPGFVTYLPKASMLTPEGFKKVSYARSARAASGSALTSADPTKASTRPKMQKGKQLKVAGRPAKPLPFTPNLKLDPLILRQRSMSQLQQQWMNVLHYLEVCPKLRAELLKHRDTIIAEWGRRHQIALNDPDHFAWPSTSVGRGDKSQQFDSWHAQGMLSYLGYHVGSTNGISQFARRQILDMVFLSVLPPVNDAAYVRGWGNPATSSRLHRLADEIARHARNGKRKRSADMTGPVLDWEADLRYLYSEYYVGRFGFGWPNLK